MISFSYREEPTDKGGIVLRPVADVFIESREGWIEFHPYIDSGADVTLIPFSLGKLIGLTVKKKNIEEIGGIRGSLPTIPFQRKLKIGTVKLTARVAWSLIEEVPPLLGRADVFDIFNVTFKQTERLILFEERS